jgi:flagella basal body P-ring formation protein FlgA
MIEIPFLLALASADGCRTVSREQILASDIPELSALPADLAIGHAPMPGGRRVFSTVELDRFAKAHGLEIASIPEACFSWPMAALDPDALTAALREAIGVDAKIQVLSSSQAAVPPGKIVFPKNGLQLPPPMGPRGEILWRGYVLYGENRRFGIWAKARIVTDVTRVVAIANISAGQPIQAEQVRLESLEDFPLDSTAARNLDEVVGFVPKQMIRGGAAILKSQVEPAPAVLQGDVVKVEVKSGAAHLVLDGKAQASGAKGSTILVKNLANGRDFRAKVIEKGRVLVTAQ